MSIEAICSTYNGLPSAAVRIRSRTDPSRPRQQLVDDRVGFVGRERLEHDRARPHGPRPTRLASRTARGGRRPSNRIGAPCTGVEQVVEQLEERRRRDVDVVDDRDQRPPAGDRLEQLADPPEQLRARELGRRQADGGRDSVGDRGRIVRPAGHAAGAISAIFASATSSGSSPSMPAGAADDLGDRPERDAVAVRQAAAAEDLAALARRRPDRELLDEPGLADAGARRRRSGAARAGSRPTSSERHLEPVHLRLPADERGA